MPAEAARGGDMSMMRVLRRTAAVAAVALVVGVWGAGAALADPADDKDCSTRPASVPDGYSCLILDEPTGNDAALEGELWFLRTADNDLDLRVFALGEITEAQVCVRTTAPYDPVNDQDDKCSGADGSGINDRVFVGDPAGSSAQIVVDLDLNSPDDDVRPIAPGTLAYFVIHVNQNGKTTTAQGSGTVTGDPEPTASATQDCEIEDGDNTITGLAITLANTATPPALDADFEVTVGADVTQHTVAAGDSTTILVDLDEDETVHVTITSGGQTLVDQNYTNDCVETPPPDEAEPTAALVSDCGTSAETGDENLEVVVSMANEADPGSDAALFDIYLDDVLVDQVSVAAGETDTFEFELGPGESVHVKVNSANATLVDEDVENDCAQPTSPPTTAPPTTPPTTAPPTTAPPSVSPTTTTTPSVLPTKIVKPPAVRGGALPATGAETTDAVTLALALLLLGGVLVMAPSLRVQPYRGRHMRRRWTASRLR